MQPAKEEALDLIHLIDECHLHQPSAAQPEQREDAGAEDLEPEKLQP